MQSLQARKGRLQALGRQPGDVWAIGMLMITLYLGHCPLAPEYSSIASTFDSFPTLAPTPGGTCAPMVSPPRVDMSPLSHVDMPLSQVDMPLSRVDMPPLSHVDMHPLSHVDMPLSHVDMPLSHVDMPHLPPHVDVPPPSPLQTDSLQAELLQPSAAPGSPVGSTRTSFEVATLGPGNPVTRLFSDNSSSLGKPDLGSEHDTSRLLPPPGSPPQRRHSSMITLQSSNADPSAGSGNSLLTSDSNEFSKRQRHTTDAPPSSVTVSGIVKDALRRLRDAGASPAYMHCAERMLALHPDSRATLAELRTHPLFVFYNKPTDLIRGHTFRGARTPGRASDAPMREAVNRFHCRSLVHSVEARRDALKVRDCSCY